MWLFWKIRVCKNNLNYGQCTKTQNTQWIKNHLGYSIRIIAGKAFKVLAKGMIAEEMQTRRQDASRGKVNCLQKAMLLHPAMTY